MLVIPITIEWPGADAAHVLTDAGAIGLALFAIGVC